MMRRRGWLVASLLMCCSALWIQRARADETVVTRPVDAPTLRVERIDSPGNVERLAAEAEAAYRAMDARRATQLFLELVELDPLSVFGWLRVGNLHHQAGRHAEAMAAYRSATLGVPRGPADVEARAKALANIALLGLEQVRRALDDLDASADPEVQEVRRQAAARARVERRRLNAHLAAARARDPIDVGDDAADDARGVDRAPTAGTEGRPRPATVPPSRGRSARPAPAAEPFEPYTVDRWSGRPRRAARGPGRSMLNEPITEDPAPVRPSVEYIEGVQDESRRAAR